jgi:putative NADH-flavin reductase
LRRYNPIGYDGDMSYSHFYRRYVTINILILGATGRVGGHILACALRDQHHVTALVRTPEKKPINKDRLTLIKGDVLNIEDIKLATHGVDVVISALNTDGRTTLTDSMPLIMDAMQHAGIKRIITIGTAGILQSRTTADCLRYQSNESKRKTARAAMEHHKVYDLLKQSTLDWTIVCPTYLPEGGIEISVPDTANFAYSQINSSEFIKSRVGIAY